MNPTGKNKGAVWPKSLAEARRLAAEIRANRTPEQQAEAKKLRAEKAKRLQKLLNEEK